MRRAHFIISGFCVVLSIISSGCTALSAQSIVRDPLAMQIAMISAKAMGSDAALAAFTSRTMANVTMAIDSSPSFSLLLETRGTQSIRRTTTNAYGSAVRITNNGVGQLTKPDGTLIHLAPDSTIGERVQHIPALSLIAEVANPSLEVTYEGADTVNHTLCDRISISQPLIGDPEQAAIFRELTKVTFWVDQKTRFVLKERYTRRNVRPTPGTYRVEVYFADYRAVQSVAVPFTQVTFTDGQPTSEVAISSVQFNVGVPDSDFAVQGEDQ